MKNHIKFGLILTFSIAVFIFILVAYVQGIAIDKIIGYSCWFENSTIKDHVISFSVDPKGLTIGTVYEYDENGILGGYTINLVKNESFYGVLKEDSTLESDRTPDLFQKNINEYCKDTSKVLKCISKEENQPKIEWIKWFFGRVTYFDTITSKVICNSPEMEQLLSNKLNNSEIVICILENVELSCEDFQNYLPGYY